MEVNMSYDYKKGKERIDAILTDKNNAKKANPIPTEDNFNEKNGC
jgi:hypothetical protein